MDFFLNLTEYDEIIMIIGVLLAIFGFWVVGLILVAFGLLIYLVEIEAINF
ncbi:Uncharacterised protein [uncultured archaeon]|nr:Uncharacterised protein [uncultured archaeon]